MQIQKINIKDIETDKNQPRKEFNEIKDLISSIIKEGLIEPLKVIENNGKYQLIDGERRYRAIEYISKQNKELEFVDCIILDKLKNKKITQLTTDIHKLKLTPIEEANAFKELIEINKFSIDDICMRLGKDKYYIMGRLKLLAFSPYTQEKIKEGKISVSVAQSLDIDSIKNKEVEIIDRIEKENANVSRTREIINEENKRYRNRFRIFNSKANDFLKTIGDFQRLINKEVLEYNFFSINILEINIKNIIGELEYLNVDIKKIKNKKEDIIEDSNIDSQLKYNKYNKYNLDNLDKKDMDETEEYLSDDDNYEDDDEETSYLAEERQRREMEGLN